MAAILTVPLLSDQDSKDPEAATTAVPEADDDAVKGDFAYRNNVAGAAKHVRMGFLRKVYGLLSVQLALTTAVAGACIMTPAIKEAVQAHPGFVLAALALSLVLLVALHFKRHQTPLNLILLACFTVVEAYSVGVVVTFCDVASVVQAFFLTATVVVGLTAFTFQSKRDFSHLSTGLFAGLWILLMGGIFQLFIGGQVLDTALAVFGALIFSAFIVFDTHMIMTRLSPEEYILATINLYMDILNLFLEILKILDKINKS